ncbi:hypothetical protein [Streptomyces sp. NPDC058548]|uniref:hypothetical protein n=1 Tax=Streptomyces sp. NPDC058548 TaxID=3346545 RepID=UPI0036556964
MDRDAAQGPSPGERWAYRVSPHHGPVSEVEVLKLGTQRPLRVKVEFSAEEAEGRQEWVSPARLRVRWEECEAWLERERIWNDLVHDCPEDEDVDFIAATYVYDTCSSSDMYSLERSGRQAGLLHVYEPAALAERLGVQPALFTSDPRALVDDDGTITTPWPTTLDVARHLAAVHAEQLVEALAQAEEKESQRAIHGQFYPGRGSREGTYISPDICIDVDRRYRPGRDLVRTWCGATAVDQHTELATLRHEVARIGRVAEAAITALRDAGQTATALRLEKQLGVPAALLREARARRDSS